MRRRRKRLRFPQRRRNVGGFTLGPKRRPRRARREAARQTVTLALCAMMVVSAAMIAGILWRSVRTKRLNEELSALHAAQEAVQTPEPTTVQPSLSPEPTAQSTPAPAASPGPTDSPAPEATAAPFHRYGGEPLAHMEALYAQNHDLVGWLEIPGVLDLPVMYRDNRYYLTHDFNKEKSAAGTIFLDENHRFSEKTQNLLLHGHNMKDGTMFGHLVHYLKEIDYYRAHPFVHFDTLWEEEEYVIFSVMRVPLDVRDENFVNYFSYPVFGSEQLFDAYVRRVQLHSVYAIPVDVKASDALLTLSICIDEDRLVVVCRRIREGESRAQLREAANLTVRQ